MNFDLHSEMVTLIQNIHHLTNVFFFFFFFGGRVILGNRDISDLLL